MRIIGGIHGGRRLLAPSRLPVRPTTDMAKEALFNILNNRIEWSEVSALDLFTGTGNISYEMASRGCQSVTAVDQHRSCISFVRETAASLNLEGIHTVMGEATKQLAYGTWDVIFADPPYAYDAYEALIEKVFSADALHSTGLFVLEHGPDQNFSEHANWSDSRRYGGVYFSFFMHDA